MEPKQNNHFLAIDYIGVAKTGWKRAHKSYECVHGIMVDRRYLAGLKEPEYEQARSLLARTIMIGVQR